MKKLFLLLALVVVVLLIVWPKGEEEDDNGGEGQNTEKIAGMDKFIVTDVDGSQLITPTGLKIQLLGLKEDNQQVEDFLRTHVKDKRVAVLADSGDDNKTLTGQETLIRRYVMLEDGTPLNRVILTQYGNNVFDSQFVKDSLTAYYDIIKSDAPVNEIVDLALYMKQRSFLIQTPEGIGTGFFVSPDGIAVTNNHVIANEMGQVYLYGKGTDNSDEFSDKRKIEDVLYTNPNLDITIFRVHLNPKEQVPYFYLAKRHAPQGADVATYGNPKGKYASYSKGVLSAYREDESRPGVMLVQYDMSTNGGNSGGAVCTKNGEVIAVHELGDKSSQNINYGIDIMQVREVFDKGLPNIPYGGR